ncbi:DUF2281 domain-containing protein [candidate division WOR-3 bacterium]|uniref:DUF2281 domain-containing protein n=1 Tax=candidate division WOR-3 bacterium TaxID=2052148 RepID=A0A938BUP5_UNCW3|nr:DUF2281 domain-containing protein [candidate division WOR-3 bacterium]
MSRVDDTVKLIRELPDELQTDVADFARFLKESRARPMRTRFRLDWAGAGRHLKDRFTSVELQHKALDCGRMAYLIDSNRH